MRQHGSWEGEKVECLGLGLTFPPKAQHKSQSCKPTRCDRIPKSLYQKAPLSDTDFLKLKFMQCGRSELLAV